MVKSKVVKLIGGWVVGCKSGFIYCLNQSKIRFLFQTSPSSGPESPEDTSNLDDSTNSPDENSVGEEVEDTGPVALPLDLVGESSRLLTNLLICIIKNWDHL